MATDDARERWERLIDVAAEFGREHPEAVLVGGTAAALYAGHRVSFDADFVVADLQQRSTSGSPSSSATRIGSPRGCVPRC